MSDPQVVFQRAWQPYTRGYILLQAFQYNTPPRLGPPPPRLLPSAAPALPLLRFLLLPQVVLNIIGFLCFSVPPQCGERLGLGITAASLLLFLRCAAGEQAS